MRIDTSIKLFDEQGMYHKHFYQFQWLLNK